MSTNINRSVYLIHEKSRAIFLPHPILKQKLGTLHISARQYYNLLKILRDFGIVAFNIRGIWFIPIKEVRKNDK